MTVIWKVADWNKYNSKDLEERRSANVFFKDYTFEGISEEECSIIRKALKLYLDYNPRKVKEKPSYEQKKLAVEMIDAIKEKIIVDETEWEQNIKNGDCTYRIPLRGDNKLYTTSSWFEGAKYVVIDPMEKIDTGIYGSISYE